MKINKDLTEALLMLSGICLVLIGTTDFENIGTKSIVMGSIGVVCIAVLVLRIIAGKQDKGTYDTYEEY